MGGYWQCPGCGVVVPDDVTWGRGESPCDCPPDDMGGVTLTVTIPGTPPREVSPNARVGWQVKARYTKVYRVMAYLATLAAGGGTFAIDGPIMLSVTYAWEKGRRTVDDDSAWALFKAGRDGMADALEVNDRRFRCGSVEQVRDPEGRGFTVVELWQEAEDE